MQLSFSFSTNIDIYDTRNFIVHEGNINIFDFVTSSLLIDSGTYFLTGPKSSGKTYICNIWNKLKKATFVENNIFLCEKNIFIKKLEDLIKQNQKYILEDIENLNIPEEYLLYIINTVNEKKSTLLITSTKYVNEFNFRLPDLKSRFSNIFNFILSDLNENSKEKIIFKLLSDKQIDINSNILSYIAKKISGNYEEINNFIKKLEKSITENQIKKISIKTLKDLNI